MATKVLCAALLLPFVWSFAIPDYSGVGEPYFSHPRDQHSNTGPRIIGGVEVTPHSYPFQASLYLIKAPNTYFCGGTLISKRWVLTAAHCLEMTPDYIIVGLGEHNLTDIKSTDVVLNTTSYIGHKSWDGTTFQNDVALVKLPRDVTFTEYIQPVQLASGSNMYAGDKATIIGWGQTETEDLSMVLEQVNATVMTNADCADINSNYKEIIMDMHICTSGTDNVGVCDGDSGGPLIVDGVQVGITSFGTTNCQLSMPSVFTRVATFHEWILQNASDDDGTDGTTEADGTDGTTESGGSDGTTGSDGTDGTTEDGGTGGTTESGGTDGTTGSGGTDGTTESGGTDGTTESGGTDGTTESGGTDRTTKDGSGGASTAESLQMMAVVLVALCSSYLLK